MKQKQKEEEENKSASCLQKKGNPLTNLTNK